MATQDLCIRCKAPVRARQEGLQCDGCERWQHRTCGSGISQNEYRSAVKSGEEIEWRCEDCLNLSAGFLLPLAESTTTVQEDQAKEPGNANVNDVGDEPMEIDQRADVVDDGDGVDDGDDAEVDEELFEILLGLAAEARSCDQTAQNPVSSSLAEPSIMDPPIGNVEINHEPVTYRIVEEGTKRRKTTLMDSIGFNYNVHSKRYYATYWQCTVRPKVNPCKASVVERNGIYQAGKSAHNHHVGAGAFTAAKVVAEVKKRALKEKFKPASAIVQEVLLQELREDQPCAAMPKPECMARAANRLRQKLRPVDPKDLLFELEEDCIPEGFLQADVTVKDRRHLIFAKKEQLRILGEAKTWYADGTFRLVRDPFKQLFTINVFVRSGDCAKQVPLVYVLMSGRKTKDYKKVLSKIIDLLPYEPEVKRVTLDFESALWSAWRAVLPNIELQGCVFHWTQALWRKIQELGLQKAYCEDDSVYRYLRKLMALPFLPHSEIQPMFTSLSEQAREPPLTTLVNYIQNQWINSNTFPPENWSIYKQAVRTNNDIEGWHNALNRHAGGGNNLPLYLLIEILGREAELTAINIKLVSERKLKRIQRKVYRNQQKKLFEQWGLFENGKKTSEELLRFCSHINGPGRS